MKKMLLLSFCVYVCMCMISSVALAKSSYYHFVGMINKSIPIVMDLNQNQNEYKGSYFYTKYGKSIYFSGVKTGNTITLKVYNENGKEQECFVGAIKNSVFSGTWQFSDKSKVFDFELKEDYTESICFEKFEVIDSISLLKNKKDSPRASFRSEYIKVKQVPPTANLSSLQQLILTLQQNEKSNNASNILQSINQEKTRFFDEYKDMNTISEEEELPSYMLNWEMEQSVSIAFNSHNFVVLSKGFYQYLGGAHGMYGDSYDVIDILTAKKLTLLSIFEKKDLSQLEKRIEKKAYVYTDSPNANSLQDAGYLVDKIEVSENFYISKEGLYFVYQPYEIAPYAAGMPTFLFTWKELEDLIKKDSPVRRLF